MILKFNGKIELLEKYQKLNMYADDREAYMYKIDDRNTVWVFTESGEIHLNDHYGDTGLVLEVFKNVNWEEIHANSLGKFIHIHYNTEEKKYSYFKKSLSHLRIKENLRRLKDKYGTIDVEEDIYNQSYDKVYKQYSIYEAEKTYDKELIEIIIKELDLIS